MVGRVAVEGCRKVLGFGSGLKELLVISVVNRGVRYSLVANEEGSGGTGEATSICLRLWEGVVSTIDGQTRVGLLVVICGCYC